MFKRFFSRIFSSHSMDNILKPKPRDVADKQRASDAMAVLRNPEFERAIDAIGEALERKMRNTDTTDANAVADVIRSKQLLYGIKRELTRVLSEGKVKDFNAKSARLS